MKKLITLCMFLGFASAYAEEPQLTIHQILHPETQTSSKPATKKATAPPVTKNTSYILSWQEDGESYQDEVKATGRSAKFCDGIRYEVENDEFSYFAKPNQLIRIRSN